ncbi:MAG: hypothetical protein M1823_000368 [Watsoniomyces obsoletus]|nr:MAG: hypothetical protein M1823_000368 [Watsoniomyces obsoletus]
MPEYIWVSDADLFNSFQRWRASTRCARRCAFFASTARTSAKPRAVLAQLATTEYCTAARAVAVEPNHAIEDEAVPQFSREQWKTSYRHVKTSRKVEKVSSSMAVVQKAQPLSHQLSLLHLHQYREFKRRLDSLPTPKAVWRFCQEGKIARSQELSRYSHAILRRLLELRTGFDDLLQFLSDGILNPPKCNNFRKIINFHKDRVKIIDEQLALLGFVKRAWLLGLVAPLDLEYALRSLLSLVSSVTSETPDGGTAMSSAIQELWRFITATSEEILEKLGFAYVFRIIQMIVQTGSVADIEALLPKMIGMITQRWLFDSAPATGTEFGERNGRPEKEAEQKSTLKKAVVKALVRSLMHEKELTKGSTAAQPTDFPPAMWMVQVLDRLPVHVSRSYVAHTTSGLQEVVQAQDLGGVPTSVVYLWMATVARSKAFRFVAPSNPQWKAIESLLATPWQTDRLVPYLRTLPRKDVSWFLFRHRVRPHLDQTVDVKWPLERLPALARKRSADIYDHSDIDSITNATCPRQRLLAVVYKHFAKCQHQRPDHYTFYNLVEVMYLYAPSYKPIVGEICNLLMQLEQPYEVYRLCQLMIRHRIPVGRWNTQNVLKDLARLNGSYALYLYCRQRRFGRHGVFLDQCRDFLQTLIYDPSITPRQVMELLLGRPEIRHINRCGSVQRQWKRLPGTRSPRAYGRFELRVKLLQELAYHFAHAPLRSDRVAFRYVHMCYLLIRFYRRPLGNMTTRAMTHAAIIRPHQAGRGVPRCLLRFILRKIKSVEGEAVADKVDELVYQWYQLNNLRQRVAQRRIRARKGVLALGR